MEEQQSLFKGRDKRGKNWFWLDNEYLNGYAKHFGAVGTAIYLSLCRHADSESQQCFPAQKKIAEELGINKDTVRKYLKIFEECCLIEITKERDKNQQWLNNIYTLLDKKYWKKPDPCRTDQHGDPCRTDTHDPCRNDTKSHAEQFGTNKVLNTNKTQNTNKEGSATIVATPTPREEFQEFLKSPESEIQRLIADRGEGSEQFIRHEVANFIGHWTERTAGGKKQRWELERTFELRRRLATWFRNADQWNKNSKGDDPRQVKILKL